MQKLFTYWQFDRLEYNYLLPTTKFDIKKYDLPVQGHSGSEGQKGSETLHLYCT